MSERMYGLEQPTIAAGYPELSGELGSETITEVWNCRKEHLGDLPGLGAVYQSDIEYFNAYAWLVLKDRRIRPGRSGEVFEATLTYAPPSDYTGSGSDPVYTTWEYDSLEFDAPLEQHWNYHTKWNNHLIRIDGATEVVSLEWWNEQKGYDGIPVAYQGKFRWLSRDSDVPEGWHIHPERAATKRASSFTTGVAVITETKRSRSKNTLIANIADDFTIQTPSETFGADGVFLRGGSKMRKEGDVWVQTVSYRNSRVIDTDLYGGSGTGGGGNGLWT